MREREREMTPIVHLVCTNIKGGETLIPTLLTLLAPLENPAEMERINRFVFAADKLRGIASRMLTRLTIAEDLNISRLSQLPPLTRTDNGRPCFSNTAMPRYDWNVSHDGDFVVFASGLQGVRNIGVDVMKVSDAKDAAFFDNLRFCFTNDEWIDINYSTEAFM